MPAPPADAADVETLWSSSDLYGNMTNEDDAWDWTILKIRDYLGKVKKENQNFFLHYVKKLISLLFIKKEIKVILCYSIHRSKICF